MKSFLTFTFLLFVLFSFSQNEAIKGHVKSIKEKIIHLEKEKRRNEIILGGDYGEFEMNNPRGTEKAFYKLWYNGIKYSYLNFIKKFNPNGTLKNEIWLHKDNSKIKKYEYLYNSVDSLTEIKEYDFHSKSYRITKKTYGDFNKPITSLSYFIDSKSYSFFVNSIDNKGNIVTTDYFMEDGLHMSEVYKYNSNNQKIEIDNRLPYIWEQGKDKLYFQKKDSLGTKFIDKKYLYDSNNNLIEVQKYNQPDYQNNNELTLTTSYIYDSNDRLIETSKFIKDYKITTKYSYDANGFIIKETCNTSNNNFSEIEYLYVENRIVEIKLSDNNSSFIIKINYTFDSTGNWIKQTKSVNGKTLFILKRKIKYYD